jgi:Fe-S-cluster containining protein
LDINYNQLRREVRRIYKETDVTIKSLSKSCHKGCSSCCTQLIKIIGVEELQITYHLDNVDTDIKEKIKENSIKWLNYFNANTPDRDLNEGDIQAFEKVLADDRVPCPFLISDECAIYDSRPIVCRTHVVESSPEQCQLNPLRPPSASARNIKEKKLDILWKLDPIPHVKLLSYPLIDYFSLERIQKRISMLVFKKY